MSTVAPMEQPEVSPDEKLTIARRGAVSPEAVREALVRVMSRGTMRLTANQKRALEAQLNDESPTP